MHALMCRIQRSTSALFLYLETRSLADLELISLARLASQVVGAPRDLPISFPVLGLPVHTTMPGFF